jgi:hypothetical protein
MNDCRIHRDLLIVRAAMELTHLESKFRRFASNQKKILRGGDNYFETIDIGCFP